MKYWIWNGAAKELQAELSCKPHDDPYQDCNHLEKDGFSTWLEEINKRFGKPLLPVDEILSALLKAQLSFEKYYLGHLRELSLQGYKSIWFGLKHDKMQTYISLSKETLADNAEWEVYADLQEDSYRRLPALNKALKLNEKLNNVVFNQPYKTRTEQEEESCALEEARYTFGRVILPPAFLGLTVRHMLLEHGPFADIRHVSVGFDSGDRYNFDLHYPSGE